MAPVHLHYLCLRIDDDGLDYFYHLTLFKHLHRCSEQIPLDALLIDVEICKLSHFDRSFIQMIEGERIKSKYKINIMKR